MVIIYHFLLLHYLEVETITLSRSNERIQSTVDRGQRVTLDCSLIPSGSVGDITYFWVASGVEISNDKKIVVVANFDEEYVCLARVFAGKRVPLVAIGFINITVTGTIYTAAIY